MVRHATPADLPRIRELLARSNEAPYDLPRVAEEKCFGAGVAGDPVVSIAGDFAGLSVTCGPSLRLLAVDRAQRRKGMGSELLRDAESRGARKIAAEPGNYFTPGVVASDTATLAFFRNRRYSETARTQNLEADLSVGQAIRPAGAGVIACATPSERERVLHFIEREFGPKWRFEASHAKTIFYVEHDGQIAGFATHEANNRGLGFFGPTGVIKRMRGRGLGRQLVLASLADLRSIGYKRAVIPWTDTIEFYEKICGARVAHRFIVLAKTVDSPP